MLFRSRAIHIFLVALTEEGQDMPTETDYQQQESVWLSLEEADGLMFFPVQINGKISGLARNEVPEYLGCKRWDSPVW